MTGLPFLLDENLRGTFWALVQRHNARGIDPVDIVRVGDIFDLPLGSSDPAILDWCVSNHRILLSSDRKTMPAHVQEHLKQGKPLPGVFIARRAQRLEDVLQFVVAAAYASELDEWSGRVTYIP